MQPGVIATLLALSVATALAGACSQSVEPEVAPLEAPPVPVVQLDPAKGAILTAAKGERLGKQCSRPSPGPITGTWSPSKTQISDLEFALGEQIERELKAIPRPGATPQGYYRQYAGLLIGGQQIIYVNGVQDSVVERDEGAGRPKRGLWTNEPVMICDGGTITFGVEYDPATKAFANFAFNGRL